MEKQLDNKILKFLWLYLSIFGVVLITIFISITMSGDLQKQEKEFIDYSLNWYTDDGKAATLNNISGEYTIYTILPEIKRGTSLYFNFKTLNVEIYRGEDCVYKTPTFEKRFFGQTPGSYFVSVPLSEQDSGVIIKLKLSNPYHDESGKVPQILLGNQDNILINQIGGKFFGFCISVIIAFLGLSFIVMFIIFHKQKIVGFELLYIGLFAFCMGIFMFTDCKLLQVIYQNAHLYHMIAEMFMMLIISPLLLFLGKMYKTYSSKAVMLVCAVSSIGFVINFMLNVTGIRDYHEMVTLTHITYGVAIICIALGIVRSIKESIKEHVFHNIGVLSICCSAIMDIVMLNFGMSIETTFFTRIGVLLFMFLEGTELLINVLKEYREIEKNKFLSRLAYHDGLTDLLNRTSFTEEIKRLEDENCENVLIAIFDVNNLKHINDNYGHAKGDALIVSVAQVIRKSSEMFGKCYRTGGDEFIVIGVGDDVENRFNLVMEQFYANIDKINNLKEFPIEIKVAMGYCISQNQDDAGLHDILEEADSRMYENKKKLKLIV